MMSDVSLSFIGKAEGFRLAESLESMPFLESETGHPLSCSTVSSSNLLLRSDNLFALKALKSLACEFDIIYIDPPYNTSSPLSFDDSHESESNWLSTMYPRLILAKQLLSEQGVFFVSIDDRQMATLTLLLREVFGSQNHIGTIKWRKKRKPSFLGKHFANVIEYVLVFSKNKNRLLKLKGAVTEEKTRPVLNASNKNVQRVLIKGTPAYCADGIYPAGIYKNRTLSFELHQDAVVQNGTLVSDVMVTGGFRVNQDILNETVFITNKFGLRRRVLDSERTHKHATDDATVHYESNEDGELQLRKVFSGQKVFDFPKPVGLIKNLIRMVSSTKCTPLLCLDFFAGTATLAQAVHELNQEMKELKYHFCCVQSEEEVNFRSTSSIKSYKTIADIAQARIEIIEEGYQIFPKCKIFSPVS